MYNLKFDELLEKDGTFKIHDRNLQKLLVETFKVKIELAPEIMNEGFDIIECSYPLGNELRFKRWNICTVGYGTKTEAFVGSGIWSYIPSEPMDSASLNEFRPKLKTWKPKNYLCKVCKIYLQRIGNLQATNYYLLIDDVVYISLFVYLFALLGFFLLAFVFVSFFASPLFFF